MNRNGKDITRIKEKIIDQLLLAVAIISIFALGATFIRDSYSLNYFFIVEALTVSLLNVIAILRHKISIKTKVAVILGIIFVIFSLSLYELGFLASGKVYLIAVPLIYSVLYSYKSSVKILIIFIAIYALFGILHTNEIILHKTFGNDFFINPKTWITDGIVLFLCAFGLLYFARNFDSELLHSINVKNSTETKYKTIFEGANDAITLLKDGTFFDCNPKACEIFQYNKNELVGKSVIDVSPEYQYDGQQSAKKAEHLIKLTLQGDPQRFEWQHKKANGEIFDLSISLSKVKLHNEEYVQAILRDITEKKKKDKELELHRNNLEELIKEKTKDHDAALEEWKSISEELVDKKNFIEQQNQELNLMLKHLEETQTQLLQAEKMASLGVLTAGVSHEINNPLQYLSGAHYVLNSYFDKHGSKDNETTTMLLASIETAISRISAIVKGLNQFSRDNSNFDEDCDIHSILDNCLIVLHNQIKYKSEIAKRYHSGTIIIKGNVGKMHQVFSNIISNAVQAIDKNGQISISTRIKDENVEIIISDNGSGISKENLTKITDPFFTTKDPGKGTGLGLSITYSIIQSHNGQLNFESEENKGTKAIITLPIKKAIYVQKEQDNIR